MFQGQRTETERALLLRSKNFRQKFAVPSGYLYDDRVLLFFLSPSLPFEFNQGRGNKSWAKPSSGNRGWIDRAPRKTGIVPSTGGGEGRGGREKNKIHASNRMFFSNRILVENPSFLVPPLERIIEGSILRGFVYPFKGTKYSPTIPTVRTLNILASKEGPLWSNCIQHVRAF